MVAAAEQIRTPCPACGCASLMVAEGGHIVCALLGCPQPSIEIEVDNLRGALEDALTILAAVAAAFHPESTPTLETTIARARLALRHRVPAAPLQLQRKELS
jgi:hypothetical protein